MTPDPGDAAAVLIHPDDAAPVGIADGARVRITSRYGSTQGIASVTDAVRTGAVSVPHGFGEPSVARLTTGAAELDPLTGMVLQSGLAVEVAPAD
jgi:anaerobic selenocysteine-containing dehydrogenase